MSASKLEKTVANLEKRLKQELHGQIKEELQRQVAQISQRLAVLEAKMTDIPKVVEETIDIDSIVEEKLDGEVKEVWRLDVGPTDPQVSQEVDLDVELPADEVEEPVAFTETAWNLVLVLGRTQSGWLDVVIACLLLFCSAGMQIIFTGILLGKDFLGEPFHEQIDIAQDWRRSVAHDYRHMDLAQTSLVARVCNGDGKLILSTNQASLLEQIDHFLGLQTGEFELPWLQTGILLCMLCILLWCLYLCQELRAVLFSLEAVSLLPRGPRSVLCKGRFLQMSYMRWAGYCLMRIARLGIAVALLYAGVQWLAGTTSITDLILNAVALSAVLQVDEMVFTALMPKRMQINIQDLEAIPVRYSNRRSQLESLLLLVFVAGIMLWSYVVYVGPLANDMLEVKKRYCAGQQDFVVASNDQQKVVMGYKTNTFPVTEDDTLSQFSVENWIDASTDSVSHYIMFHQNLGQFQLWRTLELSSFAATDKNCRDWDHTFQGPVEGWEEIYRAHWYSTPWSLGMAEGSNCSDMRERCHDLDADLLRFMCGWTCGCADPRANPIYRVTARGCSGECVKDAMEDSISTPCEDLDITRSPQKETWESFWSRFIDTVLWIAGIDLRNDPVWHYWLDRIQNLTQLGCAGLQNVGWNNEPFFHSNFCQGFSAYYAPLAMMCPLSCGCDAADTVPEYCPRSCEGCIDTPNFPQQGAITNCEQAAAAGLCQAFPDQALQLCPVSCDLCELIYNGTRRLQEPEPERVSSSPL